MKGRGVFAALAAAAMALVPLAGAGAQAPPPTTDDPAVTEGSIPPGGTINCTTAPEIDPAQGPPGTEVTVTAVFFGVCDEFFVSEWEGECRGDVTGEAIEGFSFPMEPTFTEGETGIQGTFVAPPGVPDPPVADAVEDLAVTVVCEFATVGSSPTEGGGITTYVYPSVNFALELFADRGEQPTLVVDDDLADGGVVSATPTFTG